LYSRILKRGGGSLKTWNMQVQDPYRKGARNFCKFLSLYKGDERVLIFSKSQSHIVSRDKYVIFPRPKGGGLLKERGKTLAFPRVAQCFACEPQNFYESKSLPTVYNEGESGIFRSHRERGKRGCTRGFQN